MLVNPEAAAAVRKGADFLDNNGDIDWMERIDLTVLNIASSDRCILGQLYNGNYYLGKDHFGLNSELTGKYGFAGTEIDSHLLTDAWIEFITEARKPLTPPPPAVQPEIVLTDELVELFAKRLRQINDPSHSLEETVFVVDGVRIILK